MTWNMPLENHETPAISSCILLCGHELNDFAYQKLKALGPLNHASELPTLWAEINLLSVQVPYFRYFIIVMKASILLDELIGSHTSHLLRLMFIKCFYLQISTGILVQYHTFI